MAKVKLVVSDFHLGKGRYLKDGTQNILEDFVYDHEFSEFLSHYSKGEYREAEVELILNGDILNLLQIDSYGVHTHLITERSVVRALYKIVGGHPEFFKALRQFAALPGHSVSYVIGNHDAGMLWPAAQSAFCEAVGADVLFFNEHYRFDGIHVEHGQQYERFARIDLSRAFVHRGLPEPVLNLPWGSLFVAVLLPKFKQQRPHVDKVRPFGSFLSWTWFHDFFWGIGAGIQFILFAIETLLVKGRYRLGGLSSLGLDLLRELNVYPNYDKIAFRILEENAEIHSVVFGHTHVLKYRQWREGKEYFNEGTWNEVTNLDLAEYGTRCRLTYALIEYSEGVRPRVRLKEWKGHWKPDSEVLV